MKQLNIGRLLLGGVACGAIIYIVEMSTNAVILGQDWQDWSAIAKMAFIMPSAAVSMAHWGLQTLIAGIAGTFVYAGIRSWVGVNMRAAWISGLIIWSVGWLGMSMDKMAMGIEPHKMIHYNLLAALIACLLGQIAASFIYKDRAELRAE